MNLVGMLTRVLVRRRAKTSNQLVTSVLERADALKPLTDDELRESYAQLLQLAQAKPAKRMPHEKVLRVLSWFGSWVGLSQPHGDMIEALALAYEGFARAPADLRGTVREGTPINLYPEQIQLASELSKGTFVQMGTGEGKTYGILPAALYLLTGFRTVYIVCASDYLAWRDAERTRSFWEFFDITVGLGQRGQSDAEWSAQVIYTTLRALVFRSMELEIAKVRSPYPLIMGAVILDEADAIILDGAFQSYALVRSIASESFDWELANTIASQLQPEIDIDVDYAALTAHLTVAGERNVRQAFGEAAGAAKGDFLVFRQAVEIAFIASRVVVEGEDYLIEDGAVLPIDRLTGKIDRGATPAWRFCLAHKLGTGRDYENVTIHNIVPFVVLDRFPHLSGTSGTIIDNALEYLLAHRRFVSEVPPRYERNEERLEDQVYASSGEAHAAVIAEVKSYLAAGRPVLVGAQNINDAEAIYRQAASDPEITCEVRLITGKNDQDTVRFFEDAGHAAVLTVATQLAGRGVDIRLTPEIRDRGGMALVCRGRGFEARHDRQFCGRVGRQGDPCTIQYVISLEDRLMQLFGGAQMQSTLASLGLEHGEPIQHPWVNRALDSAQRKVGRREFFRRLHRRFVEEINRPQVESLGLWFAMLRIENTASSQLCSDEFIDHAVTTFLRDYLDEHLNGRKPVGRDEAQEICDVLETQLGTLPSGLTHLALESRTPAAVETALKDHLVMTIKAAQQEWQRHVSELEQTQRAMEQEQLRVWEQRRLEAEERERAIETEFSPTRYLEHHAGDGAQDGRADSYLVDADEGDEKAADEDILASAREDDAAIGPVYAGGPEPVEQSPKFLASLLFSSAELRLLSDRAPRAIAAETILFSWRQFIHHRDSIVFRIQQTHDISFSVGTQLRRQIAAAYDRTELDLSRSVVANLMRADHGDEMDDLFFLLDSKRPMALADEQQGYDWSRASGPVSGRSVLAAHSRPSAAHELIQRFLTRQRSRFQDPRELDENQVSYVLAGFLSEHPVETLRSPQTILRAIEAWYETMVDTQGISLERARKNRAWLWAFLVSLRDDRLIGPLPGPKDRAVSWVRRVAASLGDTSVLLVGGGMVAFVLLLVLVGQVQIASPPWHWPNQELRFLDAILFAGTAENKSLLPSVILLLAVLDYVRKRAAQLPPMLRLATTVGLIGVGLFGMPALATNWDGWLWPTVKVLGFGALAWFAARLLVVLGEWMQMSVEFKPFDFWLTFTTSAIAAPMFLYRAPQGAFLLAAAIAVGVLFVVWRYRNAAQVTIRSQRIISTATMRSEEIEATRIVRMDSTIPPLLLALVMAWLSFDLARHFTLVTTDFALQIVGTCTFIAVLTVIHLTLLIRECDLQRWQHLLNSNRQQLADATSDLELKAFLDRLRRRLLTREVAAALALGLGVIALQATLLRSSQFELPIGAVLMLLGMLGATAFDRCINAVARLMSGNSATLGTAVLNVAQSQPPEQERDTLARIGKRAVEGIFKLFGLLAAVMVVIKLVAEIPNVIEVWKALRRLF